MKCGLAEIMGNIYASVPVGPAKRWHAVSAAVSIVSWHTAEVSLPLLLSPNNLIVCMSLETAVIATICVLHFSVYRPFCFVFFGGRVSHISVSLCFSTPRCTSVLLANPLFVSKGFYFIAEKKELQLRRWRWDNVLRTCVIRVISLPYFHVLFCHDVLCGCGCLCFFTSCDRGLAVQCGEFAQWMMEYNWAACYSRRRSTRCAPTLLLSGAWV